MRVKKIFSLSLIITALYLGTVQCKEKCPSKSVFCVYDFRENSVQFTYKEAKYCTHVVVKGIQFYTEKGEFDIPSAFRDGQTGILSIMNLKQKNQCLHVLMNIELLYADSQEVKGVKLSRRVLSDLMEKVEENHFDGFTLEDQIKEKYFRREDVRSYLDYFITNSLKTTRVPLMVGLIPSQEIRNDFHLRYSQELKKKLTFVILKSFALDFDEDHTRLIAPLKVGSKTYHDVTTMVQNWSDFMGGVRKLIPGITLEVWQYTLLSPHKKSVDAEATKLEKLRYMDRCDLKGKEFIYSDVDSYQASQIQIKDYKWLTMENLDTVNAKVPHFLNYIGAGGVSIWTINKEAVNQKGFPKCPISHPVMSAVYNAVKAL